MSPSNCVTKCVPLHVCGRKGSHSRSIPMLFQYLRPNKVPNMVKTTRIPQDARNTLSLRCQASLPQLSTAAVTVWLYACGGTDTTANTCNTLPVKQCSKSPHSCTHTHVLSQQQHAQASEHILFPVYWFRTFATQPSNGTAASAWESHPFSRECAT